MKRILVSLMLAFVSNQVYAPPKNHNNNNNNHHQQQQAHAQNTCAQQTANTQTAQNNLVTKATKLDDSLYELQSKLEDITKEIKTMIEEHTAANPVAITTKKVLVLQTLLLQAKRIAVKVHTDATSLPDTTATQSIKNHCTNISNRINANTFVIPNIQNFITDPVTNSNGINTCITDAMPHLELAIEETEELLPDSVTEFLKNHWGKIGTIALLGGNWYAEGKTSLLGSIVESFKQAKPSSSSPSITSDHAILGLLTGSIYLAYAHRQFIQNQFNKVKTVITTTKTGINSIYDTMYDIWKDKKSLAKAAGIALALGAWNYYARGDKSIPAHLLNNGLQGIVPCVFDQGRAIVMSGVQGLRNAGSNTPTSNNAITQLTETNPLINMFKSIKESPAKLAYDNPKETALGGLAALLVGRKTMYVPIKNAILNIKNLKPSTI
ncbi:MAG: hypothetical protein CL947_04050 [Epsilonproteobacteria bacterium]|nr:hypothetical protein [Campylobacterota bacterium]